MIVNYITRSWEATIVRLAKRPYAAGSERHSQPKKVKSPPFAPETSKNPHRWEGEVSEIYIFYHPKRPRPCSRDLVRTGPVRFRDLRPGVAINGVWPG